MTPEDAEIIRQKRIATARSTATKPLEGDEVYKGALTQADAEYQQNISDKSLPTRGSRLGLTTP